MIYYYGTPPYMLSVVDRNVVMRRMTVPGDTSVQFVK